MYNIGQYKYCIKVFKREGERERESRFFAEQEYKNNSISKVDHEIKS